MGSVDRIRSNRSPAKPVDPAWHIFEIREDSARADSVTALDARRQLMRQIIGHAEAFLNETDSGSGRA